MKWSTDRRVFNQQEKELIKKGLTAEAKALWSKRYEKATEEEKLQMRGLKKLQ